MPPLVELLPSGTTSSGATWTYTTAPPPNAHSNPLPAVPPGPASRRRKSRPTRTAASNALTSIADISSDAYSHPGADDGAGGMKPPGQSRKDEKLQKHLLEFEKDNSRDVVIPIPKTTNSNKARTRTIPPTSTPVTRRILSSQKSLPNHLSDELSLLTHHASNPPPTHPAHLSASMRSSRRDPPPPILDHPAQVTTTPGWVVLSGCSYGLPLSHPAARADPSNKPQRVFCEICGYWGRYRCIKCGARYCDLECKAGHEETRCQRFWVQ
ncbi:hypothetical protein L211DRAFT_805655 [Terfezia boudieri ATCC MYA-4762]|uniref:HIT-type domain-containing protein n=1 Tax=Terfezia boudieri ATCC MYA-4762 TaxID=1051890 RepID=A0A3N4LZ37_9PEZI|nr:hypothetical protein L211DRAFT_805655 [Terfezia boudieri ATCC MYA-4762]